MFSEACFGNSKAILQEVAIMIWRRQEEFGKSPSTRSRSVAVRPAHERFNNPPFQPAEYSNKPMVG